MTEKGKHLGIHALKIRMLVPLDPMPSPAMLRPKKNRRLIANETKPISVIYMRLFTKEEITSLMRIS